LIDIIIRRFSISYANDWSGIEPVNLLLLNYNPGQRQKEHFNLAKNQVSYNTKIKSEKEIRQSKPPPSLSKT
jgi:hypothetical protein